MPPVQISPVQAFRSRVTAVLNLEQPYSFPWQRKRIRGREKIFLSESLTARRMTNSCAALSSVQRVFFSEMEAPSLRGVPVAIGGDSLKVRTGVCLSSQRKRQDCWVRPPEAEKHILELSCNTRFLFLFAAFWMPTARTKARAPAEIFFAAKLVIATS